MPGRSAEEMTTCGRAMEDAVDRSRGVGYIPTVVKDTRLGGYIVIFYSACEYSKSCWYWQMPDGSRVYYRDYYWSNKVKTWHNGKCPVCGNTNLDGGIVWPK